MDAISIGIFLFIVGSLASLALGSKPSLSRFVSLGFAIAAYSFCLWGSLMGLTGDSPEVFWGNLDSPLSFHYRIGSLGAVFALMIAALGLVSSFYALGYAKEYEDRAANLGFFYNLFLAGMFLVPCARNVWSFLFSWEAMTVASFFLVILDHERQEARKAAYLYLVMSQISAAFITAFFFLLYRATGSLEFSVFETAGPSLDPGLKSVLFLLALIGFGIKAGVVPLHLWLPYAHPAAPSHVSALMSGVMIKTGIYGLVMAVFYFLGGGPWWGGSLVLILAATTATFGILHALMERDLKRLLAYSSIENIGIILMGVGAGMLFASLGHFEMAALAIGAGLYHAINHAVFKGLLFLGAGSVLKATHTRNMEEMGGLIKKMPVTAFAFLIGSLAISGLPPFNGFVSEWLTFQALLSGFGLSSTMARILCLVVASALALTGGLAAACFVKAFGITFLAQPRSQHAKEAKESSFFEKTSLRILSAGCLALGIFPTKVLGVLKLTIFPLTAHEIATPLGLPGDFLVTRFGSLFPLALLATLALGCLTAWAFGRLLGGPSRVRMAPTWGCGLAELTPRMQYTATAFSKPFRVLFDFLYRPVREVRQECVASPYFPKAIHFSTRVSPVVEERLYHPPFRWLLAASHFIRRLQAGSVNLYLGYLLITLVALCILFLWSNHP